MRKKRILFVQPPYIAGAMISLKEQIVQFKVKGYAIDLIISGKYDMGISYQKLQSDREWSNRNTGILPVFQDPQG